MASMTETVTPNLMTIPANVTIQKSMVARIGSNVAAVQIVHRDLLAHKGLPVLPVPLVHKAQQVKRVLSARKGLPASLVLPARKALLA